MNAAEVKAALYKRYPATITYGPEAIAAGPWTCLEEWMLIDFLAFASWTQPKPARARYARIGHEVKVSRGDMRAELLKPGKRAAAVAFCHEFYFAVPAGLLKPDEISYQEPDWQHEDFQRVPCRYSHYGADRPTWGDDPGVCHKGRRETLLVGPLPQWRGDYRPHIDIPCDGCGGKGYADRSRVEREAPTLWVPRDVGLIEVDDRGVAHVVKKAPVRKDVSSIAEHNLGEFVRWVSTRPDPRHRGVTMRAQSALEIAS